MNFFDICSITEFYQKTIKTGFINELKLYIFNFKQIVLL